MQRVGKNAQLAGPVAEKGEILRVIVGVRGRNIERQSAINLGQSAMIAGQFQRHSCEILVADGVGAEIAVQEPGE